MNQNFITYLLFNKDKDKVVISNEASQKIFGKRIGNEKNIKKLSLMDFLSDDKLLNQFKLDEEKVLNLVKKYPLDTMLMVYTRIL